MTNAITDWVFVLTSTNTFVASSPRKWNWAFFYLFWIIHNFLLLQTVKNRMMEHYTPVIIDFRWISFLTWHPFPISSLWFPLFWPLHEFLSFFETIWCLHHCTIAPLYFSPWHSENHNNFVNLGILPNHINICVLWLFFFSLFSHLTSYGN